MADHRIAEVQPTLLSTQHEKRPKMLPALPTGRFLRATLILLTALLCASASANAQTAADVNTMPLDQLARAIAHTIEVGTVRSPDAPFTFDSATVQGAKVILHFTIKDQAILAKLKADSEHIRRTTASAFCRDPQKAAPLKRGISLVYLDELTDKSDHLEYTIDATSCASLAPVTPASALELSQLASQMVNALRSDAAKDQQTQQGVTLKHIEAKNGIVEQRFVVVAPAFESFYRANIPQTQGVLKGYECSRFGDSIRRGLRLHLVYEQVKTGATLSEFNIGPSDC